MSSGDKVMNAQRTARAQTLAMVWFAVVAFGRLYTVFLCDFLGGILGLEFICYTWIRDIPSYLWIEITVYGPLTWLALHQLNNYVFGDTPTESQALQRHRRLRLAGEFAIAIVLYGIGIHVIDAIEVLSQERELTTDGAVYELAYFLDEGLSHYVQFVPLFFVMGWFVINDRPGWTAHASIAVFFGVAHGAERAIGIIEGEKWFLGPPAVLWLAFAAWLRWRRVGPAATTEFLFRYAVAFCLTLPLTQALYYGRFSSFPPVSGLSDSQHAQVTVGAIGLTVVCTVVLAALDRWWRNRSHGLAT